MPRFVFIDAPSLFLLGIELVATGDAGLVVLGADEFHQVDVLTYAPRGELQLHGVRVRARVCDREVVDEGAEVRTREPLDRVQLLGMRRAAAVEPELVVVADRV